MFDPEQLLLQPLRSALRPPPPSAQRHPAGGSHWQAGGVQPGQPGSRAGSDLLAGITAADLDDWDDWGDEEGAADGAGFDDGGGWDEAAGQWAGGGQGQPPPPQQQQQQWQQAVAVSWDEPAAAVEQAHDPHASAAPAPAPAPSAAAPSPAARTVQFEPLVELAFDYDDGGGEPEEQQQEQSQPVYAASQLQLQQQQAAWPSQSSSMGGWALQPGDGLQHGFGWQQLSQPQPQRSEPGSEPAAAEATGDPWASLEQAVDEQGSQDMEEGQQALQREAPAAQHVGHLAGSTASPAGGAAAPAATTEADPWAALGGEEEDAAADGLAGGSGWFSQTAGGAAVSSPAAAAAVAMATDPEADGCADDGSFGGWPLDVEWEDAVPAADQQLQATQQRQLGTGADAPGSSRGPAAKEAAMAAEAAEAAAGTMEGALEWGYDEPEQVTEPAAASAPGAGSLAARLAALGVLDPAVPGAAAVAAGKRRHEQIGAEIIQVRVAGVVVRNTGECVSAQTTGAALPFSFHVLVSCG